MKNWNWCVFFMALFFLLVGFCMIGGCDSSEKVVDEITGNRAVEQYEKSKQDIGNISDQQAERYSNIPGDDDEENDE